MNAPRPLWRRNRLVSLVASIKADVFDLIGGNTSRAEFAAKYGENAASAANMYKTQTEQLYDSLLDRVNAVLMNNTVSQP